jgi:hypothetical protein
MRVDGIAWHALVLEPAAFVAMEDFAEKTLGLSPLVGQEGRRLYLMRNGTMLDLYAPWAVPAYGFNEGSAFGFQVDDIEIASKAVVASGLQMLGSVSRLPTLNYAIQHFRGADGRVYGLSEVQPIDW